MFKSLEVAFELKFVQDVQNVQPLRSVQAVQRRKWVKDSDQDLFEVCARPTPSFTNVSVGEILVSGIRIDLLSWTHRKDAMARKPERGIRRSVLPCHLPGQSAPGDILRRRRPEIYLERLEQYRQRYGFSVYAYVLMSNHVHLLIETGKVGLSMCVDTFHVHGGMGTDEDLRI